MKLVEKIKFWRISRVNLSQEKAGNVLGLGKTYISMLENGEREISKAVFQKYMDADPEFFRPEDFFQPAAAASE